MKSFLKSFGKTALGFILFFVVVFVFFTALSLGLRIKEGKDAEKERVRQEAKQEVYSDEAGKMLGEVIQVSNMSGLKFADYYAEAFSDDYYTDEEMQKLRELYKEFKKEVSEKKDKDANESKEGAE